MWHLWSGWQLNFMSLHGPFPAKLEIKSEADGWAILESLGYLKSTYEASLRKHVGNQYGASSPIPAVRVSYDNRTDELTRRIALIDRLYADVLMACGDD